MNNTDKPIAKRRARNVHPNQTNSLDGLNDETHFRILHQIICSSSFHSGSTIFSSPPHWSYQKRKDTYDRHAHLNSTLPVENIPDFIDRSGSIAFLVFRYYHCSDASRWDHVRRRGTSSDNNIFYEEGVAIISEPLQDIVNSVSRCLSDPTAYYPRNRITDNAHSDEYSTAFFYHHRHALASTIPEAEGQVQDQISALVGFIDSTQGRFFTEIDNLISEGNIQTSNIQMLFCPNDILITKVGGVPTACVLRAWPSGGSTISLDCWAWGYDGHWLHRKHRTLVINRPVETIVSIRDLDVYPAKYAKPEEITLLRNRGQKFWSLRYQSFVAYEGWDFQAEQFYVRISQANP